MPKFQLDADGNVDMHPLAAQSPTGINQWIGVALSFDHLDAFTQGYIEALFFTESGDDNLGDTGFSDLAPDTLATIIADCTQFQRKADQILADCYCREGYSPEQAGRDFWFTRNHHGVGFWDREALEADGFGDVLTGIAQDEFPEVDAYLGDDGKVYLS